jgi:sensor histidine kinase YesM
MVAMSRTRTVNWRLAAGGAVLLTFLFGIQQWLAESSPRRDLDLGTSFALRGITWGVWLLLLPLIVRVAGRHPLEGRPTAGWVLRSAIEGGAFVLVHSQVAGFARWVAGLSVSSDLGVVLVNSISVGFATNYLRYSAILVAYQAVVYHDAVRQRDQRAAQLEIDLAHAKLANVEACLRPHFLFNTLNAIAALVREDPRLAEQMIGELSDLLRASLSADPSREVRLDEELAFTQKYLDLERVRFQDRLHVTIDASPEARRALVPHLLLQPLVENAVRHGIAPLEAGGSIAVAAARRNGTLHVTVRDDGVGLAAIPTPVTGGIGLRGLRARLAHLYGDGHRLDVAPATPHGTVVNIEIPYRTAAS